MTISFDFNKIPNNINKLNESFFKRVEKEKEILSSSEVIDDHITMFTKKNPRFAKIVSILRQASEKQIFRLQPLIAKYNAEDIYNIKGHWGAKISEETKHPVFILPYDHVNNQSFTYCMAISTEGIIDVEPKSNYNILKQLYIDEDEKILKNHFNLITECLTSQIKQSEIIKFFYTFTPMYPVNRMYGYDGSWIMYRVQIKDCKEKYWSPPVCKSKYHKTQPFLILPDGEFLILEMDNSDECNDKIKIVKNDIKERMKYNKSVIFEQEEEILVDESWLIAQGVELSKIKQTPIDELKDGLVTLFGKHIPYPTISGYDLTTETIIENMRRECIGRPIHRFSSDLINKFCVDYTK